MTLLSGVFTYFILTTRRMEHMRKPFFVGLSVFVFITLTANVMFLGFNSFRQWVNGWNAGYYSLSPSRVGVTPFPLPIVIPAIMLGKAKFLADQSLWQTQIPTSMALFILFMVPYILTFLIFDRAFCGWLCPFGGLPEFMLTGRKPKWRFAILQKKPSERGSFSLTGLTGLKWWVEWIRYTLLLIFIVLSFAVPFAIVNIISPALWAKNGWVFIIGSLLVAIFAVILPFFTNRRWWCYLICPVGATLALLHKISLFRIKIDKRKCNECMDCVQECRYFAMTPQGVAEGGPNSGNCIRCGRCIEACPEEAIDVVWRGKTRNVRAQFITLAIMAALAWYLWFVLLIVSYAGRIDQFQFFK